MGKSLAASIGLHHLVHARKERLYLRFVEISDALTYEILAEAATDPTELQRSVSNIHDRPNNNSGSYLYAMIRVDEIVPLWGAIIAANF
jgi:hypothetical protein